MWRVLLSSSTDARVESQPAHLHLAKIWDIVVLLARAAGLLRWAGRGGRRGGRRTILGVATRGARRRGVHGQLERKVLVKAQAGEGVLDLIGAEQRQHLLAEAVRLQRRPDHRHRSGAVRKHLAGTIGPAAIRRSLCRFVQAKRQPHLVDLRLAHQSHNRRVQTGADKRISAAREGRSRWTSIVCGRGSSIVFATAATRFGQWAREVVVRLERRGMLLERLRKLGRRCASIAHTRGSGSRRRFHLHRVVCEGLRLVMVPAELCECLAPAHLLSLHECCQLQAVRTTQRRSRRLRGRGQREVLRR